MTKTRTKEKAVWHETRSIDTSSGRSICVAESAGELLIRLKGCRQIVSLPWTMAYLKAAEMAAINALTTKRRRRSVSRGALV